MAESNDSGDKTEQPTPKRLEDARKKGNVPKSRDLSSTVGLVAWGVLGALLMGTAVQRLAALWQHVFDALRAGWTAQGFAAVAAAVGWHATEALLWLAAVLLLPIAAVGLLIERLQTGPVFTLDKLKPKLEHLNPAAGVKRMFSMDNLIELLKNVVKAALLLTVGALVARALLPQVMDLVRTPNAPPTAFAAALARASIALLAGAIGALALVAVLDVLWQRHSHTKKLRMSLRDIRQEHKDNEGDPLLKHQRKQAHAEWSQQGATHAAGQAQALIVNPTHVAIAIAYDRTLCPIPTLSAKGEDHLARAMRQAAEDAGVPIVRNVPLARELLARGEVGSVIAPDWFDIMAEVILWADDVRAQLQHEQAHANAIAAGHMPPEPPPRRMPAPGEDLTRYGRNRPPDPTHPTADNPS